MRVALPIAAIVVALVAAMAWRGGESLSPAATAAKEPQGSVTTQRRYGADVVLAIRPGAPATVPRAAAATRLSPLMKDYHEGTGWKALHDRLRNLANRTAEESYVLAEILDRCATLSDRVEPSKQPKLAPAEQRQRLAATLSERDPETQRRLAAWDRMNRGHCDGFEGVTSTDADIRGLLQAASTDPKARARLAEKEIAATIVPGIMVNGRLPQITDAQLESLRTAVQSNDPSVLSIASRIFGTTLQDFNVRTGPNQVPVDLRAFQDAWLLAACDSGLPCGDAHPRLLAACAHQGNCGAQDLREHLFFFEHSPQQSQRVAEYQNLIAQAIRTGDWSAFDFHRGPIRQGYVAWHIMR